MRAVHAMADTVFLAHAEADHEFALHLAEFLEFGCDVKCFVEDGLIASADDIVAKAEEGTWASVLVLLLSRDSWPVKIARERWEPLLLDPGLSLVSIYLNECRCPDLLRRRTFFDAKDANLMRRFKRWLWQRKHDPDEVAGAKFSSDLDEIYRTVADRAGTLTASGASAERFVAEAEREFEAVLWVPCHGRSLAQAAGELGSQLGLTLDGQLKENCGQIQHLLGMRRCLLVLDAPDEKTKAALTLGGRSSTLVTTDPVKRMETPQSLDYARQLVLARRFAEAYVLLYDLLDAVISPDPCARELAWICDHWGRLEEANRLREQSGLSPTVQLALFD
jgi:hypothetical protein